MIEYWVISPDANAESVAHMEEVLDTRAQPCVVLRTDEQPVQLRREVCKPPPAINKHSKRIDYGHEQVGVASLFMFTEPLVGQREVAVRLRKTKVDWAIEMSRFLEGRYTHFRRVTLVCDQLNTHTKGAFYEAFEPERTRQLVSRIEFRHTPKHGS